MDKDLNYIIEEEKKFIRLLENSKSAARKRVEDHRLSLASQKDTEFKRIESEFKRITEVKLQEIKDGIAVEREALRLEDDRLIADNELKKKITGRIVTVILENRA